MRFPYTHHPRVTLTPSPDRDSVNRLKDHVSKVHYEDKVIECPDSKSLAQHVKSNQPGVFVLSTPHGPPADKAVDGLKPHLSKDDIIIDCGNEHYANTERRQADLEPHGISYIGCGVSGGYQSARSGPSFSPGGDAAALDKLMPFFRRIAAKDREGNPCTAPVGPGSSGHYAKMVHNGIEQGMMSAVAEAWLILVRGLGLTYAEAGDVFAKWNESGPLKDCFLVAIGADVNRAKDEHGEEVLKHVRDKVVQDYEGSEGTGTWTAMEAVANHIPAATIMSAHLFRCASADVARRMSNKEAAGGGHRGGQLSVESKGAFIDALQMTVYFCFLCAFAQGMNILRCQDKQKNWGLDYTSILQLWRGGSIIAASHVIDVLDSMYRRPDHDPDDVLSNEEVSKELERHVSDVKQVVLKAVEADEFVPSISQSLEFFKYSTATDLPTQFMEAQLDYFGEHMFDRKEGPPGKPETGGTHFEWKPAKGASDSPQK